MYLFCDEFTDYNDVEVGRAAVELLEGLGYVVEIPRHLESGRTYLSKGLVREAKKLAQRNVELLRDIITADAPLVGIEPSAILTFRDAIPLAGGGRPEACRSGTGRKLPADRGVSGKGS